MSAVGGIGDKLAKDMTYREWLIGTCAANIAWGIGKKIFDPASTIELVDDIIKLLDDEVVVTIPDEKMPF